MTVYSPSLVKGAEALLDEICSSDGDWWSWPEGSFWSPLFPEESFRLPFLISV